MGYRSKQGRFLFFPAEGTFASARGPAVNTSDRSAFEKCVLASGLLTEQQLDEARTGGRWLAGDQSQADAQPTDRQIADRLIEMGRLNPWQAKQLLQGRTKFNLGPYLIVDSIGQGGMGQVFKAEHNILGRVVAIKVLPLSKTTPDAVTSFTHEIRALASLDHHRLVRALDAGHDGNVYYLVTEYVPGSDLRKLVRRNGPLDMQTAAEIISQVAEGLHYAHQQGLVHRDVKPGNVLVSPEGDAKLSDLGLAGPLEGNAENDPRYGKIVGTADYVSPDHVQSPWDPTPAWDIYSLGCTLYYAATGNGKAAREAYRQAGPPSDHHRHERGVRRRSGRHDGHGSGLRDRVGRRGDGAFGTLGQPADIGTASGRGNSLGRIARAARWDAHGGSAPDRWAADPQTSRCRPTDGSSPSKGGKAAAARHRVSRNGRTGTSRQGQFQPGLADERSGRLGPPADRAARRGAGRRNPDRAGVDPPPLAGLRIAPAGPGGRRHADLVAGRGVVVARSAPGGAAFLNLSQNRTAKLGTVPFKLGSAPSARAVTIRADFRGWGRRHRPGATTERRRGRILLAYDPGLLAFSGRRARTVVLVAAGDGGGGRRRADPAWDRQGRLDV